VAKSRNLPIQPQNYIGKYVIFHAKMFDTVSVRMAERTASELVWEQASSEGRKKSWRVRRTVKLENKKFWGLRTPGLYSVRALGYNRFLDRSE